MSRRWPHARAAPTNTFITLPARPRSKPSPWGWHAKWLPMASVSAPLHPVQPSPTSTPRRANPTGRCGWPRAFPWAGWLSPRKSPKPLPGCSRRPRLTSPAPSCTARAACKHSAQARPQKIETRGTPGGCAARFIQCRPLWGSGLHVGRLFLGTAATGTQLRDVAHCAAVGRCCHGRIGQQRLRYDTLTVLGLPGLVAARFHLLAPLGQLFVADGQMNAAIRDIDFDRVAILHQRDVAALGRFGRGVADDQTRRAAREPAVGEQRRRGTQTLGLEVGRGVEHFLHARASLGAFVADDDDVARLHLIAQDAVDRVFLAFEHARPTREGENAFVDPRG